MHCATRTICGRLKALVEIEKEDWAHKMQRLLRQACHATNLAREQGVPLTPGLIALIELAVTTRSSRQVWEFHEAQPALAKARRRGRPPRRVGHNLLLRLPGTRKSDVLRFLTIPLCHFTNNLAEQDGRMMKLRQKISGGFRCEDVAKDFAGIRSMLSTAGEQGWDLLRTLSGDPVQTDRRHPAGLIAPCATWAVTTTSTIRTWYAQLYQEDGDRGAGELRP